MRNPLDETYCNRLDGLCLALCCMFCGSWDNVSETFASLGLSTLSDFTSQMNFVPFFLGRN